MVTVSHNDNPIIFTIDRERKYTKNLNNVLNQNVNETKRARFTTFTIARGTQREYSSKPLEHSNVKRILVLKR